MVKLTDDSKYVALKVWFEETRALEERSGPSWVEMRRDRAKVRKQVCDFPIITTISVPEVAQERL